MMQDQDLIQSQTSVERERRWKEEQKRISRRQRKDTFWGWVISIGLLVLALMPSWGFLLVYHFSAPANFVEKIAVIGLGVWVAGSLQAFLLLVWIAVMIQLISDW